MPPQNSGTNGAASAKLEMLLTRIWQSPVFGNSYQGSVDFRGFTQKLHRIHARFVADFRPLLERGCPDFSAAEIDALVREIAPKTTAFCSSLAVEIEDVDRLVDAAVLFAITYLGDSLMDDRDVTTIAAALRFMEQHAPGACILAGGDVERSATAVLRDEMRELPAPNPQATEARLEVLSAAVACLARLASQDDASLLVGKLLVNVWVHGSATRQLSARYLRSSDRDAFWATHATDFVAHTSRSVATDGMVGVVYALYRAAKPHLPSLQSLLALPPVSSLCDRPLNAAARVFDDVGDQDRDGGPGRAFDLNLFVSPHPTVGLALARFAGLPGEVDFAGQPGVVIDALLALTRARFASLPAECVQEASLLLQICKRAVESQFVNALGDTALTA
jgi:hypothetical protein